MLRSLPGVLSDFVNIREEQISQKTGLTMDIISKQLKSLERLNFLTYIPRNDKPQIQFLTPRIDTRYFSLSDEIYKNRKEDAARRVQAVIDFVNNNEECRSVQLLRYFGENIKKSCNKCDVCSSKNKMSLSEQEYKEISEAILMN
jgi:ATP-dependent DNA helicase RecQ